VIRPPYRLLIDERRLPRPGGPQARPGDPQARPGEPQARPRPGGARPGGARPDIARPDLARPDLARPIDARPRPVDAQPRPGDPQPRPGGARPRPTPPPGPRERALVLALLRSRWRPEALAQARALAAVPALDWPAVVELARNDGVAPLVAAAAKGGDILPPQVLEELRYWYLNAAVVNTALEHEVARTLELLAGAGLETLALKGMALLRGAYPDIGLRPMQDADLLVRRADYARACDLLAQSGFRAESLPYRRGACEALEREALMLKPAYAGTIVELHREAIGASFYDSAPLTDHLRATSRPGVIDGAGARVPSPEGMMLHLAAHSGLTHARTAALHHLYDAAVVASTEDLDWADLARQAMRLDLVTVTRELLTAAAELLGAPAPEQARQRLRSAAVGEHERRMLRRARAPLPAKAANLAATLASLPDQRARARLLGAVLAPSAEYMRRQYGVRGRVALLAAYPYRWSLGVGTLLGLR